MTENRSIKNIKEIKFEDISNKKIVSKENFATKVIQHLCSTKYFYSITLIGIIDYISYRYMIYCKESYNDLYDYLIEELQEIGIEYIKQR